MSLSANDLWVFVGENDNSDFGSSADSTMEERGEVSLCFLRITDVKYPIDFQHQDNEYVGRY